MAWFIGSVSPAYTDICSALSNNSNCSLWIISIISSTIEFYPSIIIPLVEDILLGPRPVCYLISFNTLSIAGLDPLISPTCLWHLEILKDLQSSVLIVGTGLSFIFIMLGSDCCLCCYQHGQASREGGRIHLISREECQVVGNRLVRPELRPSRSWWEY